MEVSPQHSSWWRFVSLGGFASLGVSTALFQLGAVIDRRILELDETQPLETLAGVARLAPLLPLSVALRGRITCREPSTCELTGGSPAVMRELLEEELYFKEHSSGRVTHECFETRREREQREAFLEDVTASIKLDNLQHASGLTGVMEVKQVFRPVDVLQGTLLQHLVNKAFKSMVKHGVRVTERFLPVGTTVTVVGELVPDTVGHGNGNQHLPGQPGLGGPQGEAASKAEQSQGQGPTGSGPPPPTSTPGYDTSTRAVNGAAASTSGRPLQSSVMSAAAAAAGAEVLGQAALAVGSAALQVLPYTVRKPARGPFYVTTHTLPQLRSGLERTSKTLRAFAWGFGLLGAVLVARRVALQLWRIREHRRLKRLLAEADAARRQRLAQRGAAGEGGGGGGNCGGARLDGGGDAGLGGPGTCVVCLDRDAEVVFSGCGHMCTCYSCTANLHASKCPICRVASRTIRVYRP